MVEYKRGDLIIVWKPELCRHAGICVSMLPHVYNPTERPWVKPQNASREELIQQIEQCPSAALSYRIEETEE